jgi:hypothetical protein
MPTPVQGFHRQGGRRRRRLFLCLPGSHLGIGLRPDYQGGIRFRSKGGIGIGLGGVGAFREHELPIGLAVKIVIVRHHLRSFQSM